MKTKVLDKIRRKCRNYSAIGNDVNHKQFNLGIKLWIIIVVVVMIIISRYNKKFEDYI